MTSPQTTQALPLAQSLEYVITWLEGGCDPKEAAKELRLLQERSAPLEGASALLGSQALMIGQIAAIMKYPEEWDTAVYPTLVEACDAMNHAAFCHADNQGADNLGFECPPIAPAAPQPLAPPPGYALVPLGLLSRAVDSLGSFVSDHGWAQSDMGTMDELSAISAAPQPPASALPLAVGVEPRLPHHLIGLLVKQHQDGTAKKDLEAWASDAASLLSQIAAASPPPPGEMVPLTEDQIMECIAKAGCFGNVKMSFESGPYSIDRPSFNATKLIYEVEKAHGITPGGIARDGGEAPE